MAAPAHLDYRTIAYELAQECRRLRVELEAERKRPWYARILRKPVPVPHNYAEEMLEELRLRMKATRLLSSNEHAEP